MRGAAPKGSPQRTQKVAVADLAGVPHWRQAVVDGAGEGDLVNIPTSFGDGCRPGNDPIA